MAEKGIDYRVEYGNFVLFGHDCGFGCRQTNNAPDDRTFQVSVVTCRRAPLHGGIPVDTRGSASRMARLSPLGARFAPCGGAGWKLGFQFYRKKFTPAPSPKECTQERAEQAQDNTEKIHNFPFPLHWQCIMNLVKVKYKGIRFHLSSSTNKASSDRTYMSMFPHVRASNLPH